jgi:hypothetical protein
MAPSLPLPIGKAFSQVPPDGVLYQSFKPGLFCEKPVIATNKKKTECKQPNLAIELINYTGTMIQNNCHSAIH